MRGSCLAARNDPGARIRCKFALMIPRFKRQRRNVLHVWEYGHGELVVTKLDVVLRMQFSRDCCERSDLSWKDSIVVPRARLRHG
jgi:hypothetical protein